MKEEHRLFVVASSLAVVEEKNSESCAAIQMKS